MVPDKGGTPQYYTFKVMAYGCRPAVTVVTRLLRPIKAFLHTLGIKFSIYIDDGRISASTSGLCSQHMEFTLHVLQLAGWKIQWKKTHLTPTQQLLHLGFVTDSNTMTYSITSAKWTVVKQSLSSALTQAASSTPFSALDAASLLGRLSSLHRSHGSIVRILSHSLQHQLGTHVIAYGWIGAFMISQASQRELVPYLLNSYQVSRSLHTHSTHHLSRVRPAGCSHPHRGNPPHLRTGARPLRLRRLRYTFFHLPSRWNFLLRC
jgi:hypothetical protein